MELAELVDVEGLLVGHLAGRGRSRSGRRRRHVRVTVARRRGPEVVRASLLGWRVVGLRRRLRRLLLLLLLFGLFF